MDSRCLIAVIVLTGANIGTIAMFLNYKAKFDKKSIILEKHDNQQKARITELEKKNGTEQRQINQLKQEIAKLKMKIYHN